MQPGSLTAISRSWIGKINKAIKRKASFTETGELCMSFFADACGFMYDSKFKSRWFNGSINPRFKITLSKAFELVAIFGPSLYWQNPRRVCRPRDGFGVPPQAIEQFADPQLWQMFQQANQSRKAMEGEGWIRSQLFEQWLNYTPTEQPHGGLASASEKAITEALIKGRGCLWSEPYKMPGGNTVLTGNFYDTVDNLLIDPDAESIEEAWWIARRYVRPTWQVEREYNLPKGSLREYANAESRSASAGYEEVDDLYRMHRATGESFDQIVYYKVWSKGGVGGRLSGVHSEIGRQVENQVGDYAHIVVASGVDFPLNAHPDAVKAPNVRGYNFRTPGDLFEWPVPFWKDNKWPVEVLDFYRKPRDAWPIAPIAPGLGELIFLNVMTSHLATRIWNSSQDLIAVVESAADEVKAALKRGRDMDVITINDAHKSLDQVVSVLQKPNVQTDVWRIIAEVADQFEKRTGLSEIFYGRNPGGTNPRSATESKQKREMAGIRPDWMGQKVEEWQSQIARSEKLVARWFVEGRDVEMHLGKPGALLWEQLITNRDPELSVREVDATVEAGSAKKPNKDRQLESIMSIGPTLIPELSKIAQITTDPRLLQYFFNIWGEAMDVKEIKDLQLPPMAPPPPPPEQQQMQQQQMQMEQQKMQMEVAKLQADVQKAQAAAQKGQIDAQSKMQMAQIDAQLKQLDAQLKMATGQQKMQLEAQSNQQKLAHNEDLFAQKMEQKLDEGQMEMVRNMIDSTYGQEEHRQDLRQDEEKHGQEMRQDEQVHDQDMEQDREKHRQDLRHAKQQQSQQADGQNVSRGDR